MFEIGDYVVYRNNGVCKVEDVGPMEMPGAAKDRIYYTLVPIYSKGSKVYTPTDNDQARIRPVISKREATDLIENIKDVDLLWVNDDKRREMVLKEALGKCDCLECIKVIKTLYLRKKTRLAEGKKVTASDEKYLRLAEEFLYGELAIPLEMEKDRIEEFIIGHVDVDGLEAI